MKSLIDLHIHIVPGIDDGSGDMETSLAMARMASESGVRHMAVTPHSMRGIFDNYAGSQMEEHFHHLRQKIHDAGINLEIYQGMEVFADDHLVENLKNQKIWTINHTKYFLMEFDFGENPEFCHEALYQCQQLGYTPIVAHPERYYFVQDDPQMVYAWFCGGCAIQVNKGSLLGYFGHRERETARRLLKHGVVSIVGSDAHNTSSRSPSMHRLQAYLEEYYGEEYAELLLHENPSRILKGKELVGYQPIPFIEEIGEYE